MDASQLQLIILPAGIIAILFAMYLARDVLSRDTGTAAMQDVAGTIYEGATAFIRRQYTTIGILAIVGAVVIGIVIGLVESAEVADVPKLAGLPIGVMTGFRPGAWRAPLRCGRPGNACLVPLARVPGAGPRGRRRV